MNIESCIDNNILRIFLSGELDECSANFGRSRLDSILSNNNYSYAIMDMSRLDFMDSTGIGVLIGRYKKVISLNKKIYISNPSKTIDKIFNMSGIYEIMPKIS